MFEDKKITKEKVKDLLYEVILWYNDIRKRKEKRYGKEICSNNVMY